jgi:hypothetical protein
LALRLRGGDDNGVIGRRALLRNRERSDVEIDVDPARPPISRLSPT